MKRLLLMFCVVVLAFTSSFFFGCSKSDTGATPAADPTAGPGATIHKYSGSASKGDLIVFDVNTTDSTIKAYNETTAQTIGPTTYSAVTATSLPGVLQVTIADTSASGGDVKCFAVELGDNIIATNFPIGTIGGGDHYLSFGVKQSLDNTGNSNLLAGDYVFCRVSNQAVNGSTGTKEWGLLNVKSDGTWRMETYATNTGGSVPAASPDNSASYQLSPSGVTNSAASNGLGDDSTGTWTVNSSNKERLKVWDDSAKGVTLTGYAYVHTNGQAAFLLDLGVNQGYMIGLKQPATAFTQADIAGTYKFVDIWYNGGAWPGAGKYVVASDGSGSYFHIDAENQWATGNWNSSPAVQCSPLTNMFVVNVMPVDADGNGVNENYKMFMIVIEDVIMHFMFDGSGNFVSYGVGAKTS